ncbi:MAG: hypothetical protein ACPGWR_30220 [Ardenticatenaceae bacterium]
MSNFKQYLIGVLGLLMGLVGDVVNVMGMMSWENGWLWLLGLFVAGIGYKVSPQVWGAWQRWRASQRKLRQVGDLVLGAARGEIIRQCALIRRIREEGHAIRIRSVLSADLVLIDVSELALREDDELKGTKWALTSHNRGGRIEGEVIGCDRRQAHLRLPQPPPSVSPQEGDFAIPIEPAQATESESLLVEILRLIRQ